MTEEMRIPSAITDDNSPLPGYDYWDIYPDVPIESWLYEVANGDTRVGYWEYVKRVQGLVE